MTSAAAFAAAHVEDGSVPRLVVRGSARDPLIGPLTSQAERRRVGHLTNLAPIDADLARPAPVG
ncbi:hypothetical protein [Benzoatithermus flavus]|uniref:Uncharacterized protein n=1 Tax=Benzoatithermus flavus TaxID=3108223 RepID=A0ABU8XUI1_9PROT